MVKEQQNKSEVDQGYSERDELVSFISRLYPSHLSRHEDEDKGWDNDWRTIVCVHSPNGQLSWHIHDSEIEKFSHLDQQENDWDGHTTEEKYIRLKNLPL